MRYKPSFILYDIDGKSHGMNVLYDYFVKVKGFELDALRTLIVKYPYILSKTSAELESYFQIMKELGLTEKEAMKSLLDCPKLVSKNLDHQVKEITFLFNLYHGINEREVMEIF